MTGFAWTHAIDRGTVMCVFAPTMLLCTSRATSSGPTVWANFFVAMPEISAVRVKVGLTVFTRTPCGASSTSAASEKTMTPAFAPL